MKIPIDHIDIGTRQRTDLGDPMTELASMGDPDVGLIQPITVERQLDGRYLLIAGNRRLTKAKSLGWTTIEANEKNGLTEVQRQKMEFIEDVERKDRSWQEKCIATYKLYHLIRLEKMQDGATFTVRAMATFTGYEKSTLGYFIQIGEALANPEEKEIRECENYTKAVGVLIGRTAKKVQDEMDRRAAIAMATERAQLVLPVVDDGEEGDSTTETGGVQLLDTTLERTTVYLHGYPFSFDDAIPDKHFMAGYATIILGLNVAKGKGDDAGPNNNLISALRKDGYVILWNSWVDLYPLPKGPELIWNTLKFNNERNSWPYISTHVIGTVFSKAPAFDGTPLSNVITAMPDGPYLPPAVVDFSISHIVTENMAVTCIGDINPVDVAMLGRVPIWYEPDPVRYAEKEQALVEWYERTIPGVDIKRRTA